MLSTLAAAKKPPRGARKRNATAAAADEAAYIGTHREYDDEGYEGPKTRGNDNDLQNAFVSESSDMDSDRDPHSAAPPSIGIALKTPYEADMKASEGEATATNEIRTDLDLESSPVIDQNPDIVSSLAYHEDTDTEEHYSSQDVELRENLDEQQEGNGSRVGGEKKVNHSLTSDTKIKVLVKSEGTVIHEHDYEQDDKVVALRDNLEEKDGHFWDLYMQDTDNSTRALNDNDALSDIAVLDKLVVEGLRVDWIVFESQAQGNCDVIPRDIITPPLQVCKTNYELLAAHPSQNSDVLGELYGQLNDCVAGYDFGPHTPNDVDDNFRKNFSHLAKRVVKYAKKMHTNKEQLAKFAMTFEECLNGIITGIRNKRLKTMSPKIMDDSKAPVARRRQRKLPSRNLEDAAAEKGPNFATFPDCYFRCACCGEELIALTAIELLDNPKIMCYYPILRVKPLSGGGNLVYPDDWTKHMEKYDMSRLRYSMTEINHIISRKLVEREVSNGMVESDRYFIRLLLSLLHTFSTVHLCRHGKDVQSKLTTHLGSSAGTTSTMDVLQSMLHFCHDVLVPSTNVAQAFSNTKSNFVNVDSRKLEKLKKQDPNINEDVNYMNPFSNHFKQTMKQASWIPSIYKTIISDVSTLISTDLNGSSDDAVESFIAQALKRYLFDDTKDVILCEALQQHLNHEIQEEAETVAVKVCDNIAYMIMTQVKDWKAAFEMFPASDNANDDEMFPASDNVNDMS